MDRARSALCGPRWYILVSRGALALECPEAGKDVSLPKPNYQFEKRRRELDKKKKDEEKKQKKLERARAEAANPGGQAEPAPDGEPEST